METLQNAPARHGQAATKHPLVSVVMPAYNAEKYIGEAIRSVQSQTYAISAICRRKPLGICHSRENNQNEL